MATSTPPPALTNVPPPRPPVSSTRGGLLGLVGLGVGLALLLYLPALLDPAHDPTAHNLVTLATGWQPGAGSPAFWEGWQTAGRQLRAGHLPLWQPSQYQPLLEATEGPFLYPGSLLFYLGGSWGLWLFGLAHLVLLSVSGLTLAWRGRGRWLWVALIVLVVVAATAARPDWTATLAWLGPALWLAEWHRRRVAMILLPLPLAMMALAGPLPLTLSLYALAVGWWLRRPGLGLLPRLALVGLALVGGLALAGPQLFPRLTYTGPAYDPTLPTFVQSVPVVTPPAQLIDWQTEPDGGLSLRLKVPLQADGIEVRAAGRPDLSASGWTGQLSRLDNGKKGPEVRVTGDKERRAVVVFDPQTTSEGDWLLRLRYGPLYFNLGLYALFLALMSQTMLVVVVGWLRFYQEEETDHPLRRVVKNSATPLFAQLSGKVIDFTFAIFVLRLLGPDGNGQWTFATTTWLFFATLSDFGLESLVTREIARARALPNAQSEVNRLFVTKLFLRLGLSILMLPLALLWLGSVGLTGHLTAGSFWAVVLLMIGFWPTSVIGSITVVFRGYEKFEFLAATQLLSSVIRVPLGMAALLMGWGVVGLAAASLGVNAIQLGVLQSLLRRQFFKPRLGWQAFDWPFARQMLGQAFPLMLNGFIINVLFKSDGLVLQAIKGNAQLGIYNSAYKFVDALLIIPSALTLALFPLFSAYSTGARENLVRAYREGLRILTIIALPVCVGTLFVAHDLIGFLGGSEFLPGGATALQILIWFLPFSYINGLTQYVLIAVDQQKQITKTLIVAALSNVGLNLLLIPFAGFAACAALTVLTELIILGPFVRITRRTLGPTAAPIFKTLWRPGLAVSLMGLALGGLLLLGINQFVVTVIVGGGVYLVGLVLTRAVTRQDLALLKKIVRR